MTKDGYILIDFHDILPDIKETNKEIKINTNEKIETANLDLLIAKKPRKGKTIELLVNKIEEQLK